MNHRFLDVIMMFNMFKGLFFNFGPILLLIIFYFVFSPSLLVLFLLWRLDWRLFHLLFVMVSFPRLLGLLHLYCSRRKRFKRNIYITQHFLLCSPLLLPSHVCFVGFDTDWFLSPHFHSLEVTLLWIFFLNLRIITEVFFYLFTTKFGGEFALFNLSYFVLPKYVNLFMVIYD